MRVKLLEDGSGVPLGPLPNFIVGIKKKGEVYLHPLEVLYLVLEGHATVEYDGKEIKDFKEAIAIISDKVKKTCEREKKNCYLAQSFWSMFTTYYKLRRKGRKVLPEGRREGTLIEIRKNQWWAEYLVLEESVKISLQRLLHWIKEVRANDLKAIIAVVDRNGSVTFYEANKVTFKALDRQKEEGQRAEASS